MYIKISSCSFATPALIPSLTFPPNTILGLLLSPCGYYFNQDLGYGMVQDTPTWPSPMPVYPTIFGGYGDSFVYIPIISTT